MTEGRTTQCGNEVRNTGQSRSRSKTGDDQRGGTGNLYGFELEVSRQK